MSDEGSKRVLFIVPYTPNLIRVRPYQLIRSLVRRGHQLTLATLWTSEAERADLERLATEDIQVLACRLPPWRSLWNCLRALPTRVPLQAVYCWQPALARHAQHAIRNPVLSESEGTQYDVAHVEHLRGARYGLCLKDFGLRTSDFGLPIVWDSVDCISYLFAQATQHSRSLKGRLMTRLELERTRRFEGWLVGQFDHVLVTSPVDREALVKLHQETRRQELALSLSKGDKESRRQGDGPPLSPSPPHLVSPSPPHLVSPSPPLPITVLPNGVDLDYFTPTDEPRDPATLVITGKMSYHANVTAVLHLVNDVMPHVWVHRPDVHVWIVGKDPPREIRQLESKKPGFCPDKATFLSRSEVSTGPSPLQMKNPVSIRPITVAGTVPDIRPYLRRATLAVAPVPYGAGVQNKVLEAMACGTPVVASPQAISALAAQPGRELVVADGAEAFAQAVLALLDDPARRAQLAQAGRAYVEQHHDWDAIAARLEAIYQDAISH